MDSPARPLEIVVLEDSPGDVLMLRYALDRQSLPYRLRVLGTGEDALQFIREHAGDPDKLLPSIFVMDLHMPRFEGLEILKLIRKEDSLAGVMVAVLTGGRSPSQIRRNSPPSMCRQS